MFCEGALRRQINSGNTIALRVRRGQEISVTNILYLHSEYVAYLDAVLSTLSRDYRLNVTVVSWDEGLLKPYRVPDIPGVSFIKRSTLDERGLANLIETVSPEVIVTSGWMDRGYVSAIRRLRSDKPRVPLIVTGMDSQWLGTLRQRLGALYFRKCLLSIYDYAWVAGGRQYEYAKRLGFVQDRIIFDVLSANNELFALPDSEIRSRVVRNSKTFLYVGNLREVKGVDVLIEAFALYREDSKDPWSLTIVGNGELVESVKNREGIHWLDFLPQNRLVNVIQDSSVFVLPSRLDKWGVVVQEFALAGMPLIVTKTVGSGDTFCISDYNGFVIAPDSPIELAKAMRRFEQMESSDLLKMGLRSSVLGRRISPETSAANLMKVVVAAAKVRA